LERKIINIIIFRMKIKKSLQISIKKFLKRFIVIKKKFKFILIRKDKIKFNHHYN
jgi:hypothetical protein